MTDVLVRVHAGQSFEPRRTTANQLSVKFTPKPGVRLEVGRLDAVLSAVVSAWYPAAAAIRDSRLIGLTRGRGSRSIPVGYRTWIGIAATQLVHSRDGVLVVPEAEGALIVVPDGWDPHQVVAAVLDTLQENNITALPAG